MSAVEIFKLVLLTLLVVCAVAVSFNKNILASIVIYTSYSLVMCVIWILLESPDLAITEAAVGAGITSLLFFVTLKKIRMLVGGSGDNAGSSEMHEKGLDSHDEAQSNDVEVKSGSKTAENGDKPEKGE